MLRKVSRTVLGTRRTGQVAILLALALAAAACQTGRPARTPQATVPKAIGTTPTSAPATNAAYAPTDPYAVPSTITKPYVQKVLNALDQVDASALRIIVSAGGLSPPAAMRLRSVTTSAEFPIATSVILNQLNNGPSIYQSNPGSVVDDVQGVVSATSTCIFTETKRDYSSVLRIAPQPQISYIELRPRQASDDPQGINPTHWVIAFQGHNSDNSAPNDPCTAP